MVRIQVQLEPEQHRRLRRRARRLGVSISELIRRSVDAELKAEEPSKDERIRRALAVCGKYAGPSGETDAATHHDEVVAEAYRR